MDKSSKQHVDKTPLAYQKGYADFYGRNFIVTPDVLIPRPETEQIIDQILILAGKPYLPGVKPTKCKLPQKPVILDVGTGSGCIAVTIKKELDNADVYASDVSVDALDIAKKNAKKHETSINFLKSDLLEKIQITPDILIANLPYVDPEWSWLDKESLDFEPSLALYAGDHGLELIKELIRQAKDKNIEYIILESDPCQHKTLIDFAKKHKYNLKDKRGFITTLKIA